MVISLPSESYLLKLVKRSVLIRSSFELWGRSKSPEDLHDQLKRLPTDVTSPYFTAKNTFKIVVDIFNKVISQQEKIDKIEVNIQSSE